MIKVLAIDDEPLALQQLAAYISKVPFLELAGECQSALEAREILNSEAIDAIFCDINMPDLNGMDFVKSLSAPPLVVFTTAYAEYAVEGFRVDAVDYLLKPFGLDDFRRAANRLKERILRIENGELRMENYDYSQGGNVSASKSNHNSQLSIPNSQDLYRFMFLTSKIYADLCFSLGDFV
jgi:DNA-binding LytR/AlgR family response regulator